MAYQSAFQPSYLGYNPAAMQMGYQVPNYQQPSYDLPKYQQVASMNTGNGIIWVQGEAGAKSYLVAPNTTVLLMDSENPYFYLKSTDASGVPLPLRKFKYIEEGANPQTASPVADQTILDDFAEQINALKSNYSELSERIDKLTAEPKKRTVKAVEDNA